MSVEYSIARNGFEDIVLDTVGGGPFGLQRGTTGLGHPPLAIFTQPTVGEGSVYLGERVEEQPMALRIVLLGDQTVSSGELAARLYNMVRSRDGIEPPRIVATFSTGEVYEISFRYVSGLEGDGQELPHLAEKTLALVCPRPFWTARNASQVAMRAAGAGSVAFLSRLARLPLKASSAFGQFEVDNPGDESSFVDWRVLGPAEAAAASIDGVGWSLDASLAEGEVRLLDGRQKTVVDGVGASAYSELGAAPKFPMLRPGRSMVTISVDGADPGEWVVSDDVLYTNLLIEPTLTAGATKWGTWSDGNGTGSHATTGFDGGAAGYMQVTWSGDADPAASIRFEVDAAEDDLVSPSMQVLSSKDQVVQGAAWVLDDTGNVLRVAAGPSVETPAGLATHVTIPGMIIGRLPAGTATVIFAVSVFASLGQDWASGDTFRASFGAATDTEAVLTYFDGATTGCDWTGTTDGSTSVQYALELVGASEVAMVWKPRRALVY